MSALKTPAHIMVDLETLGKTPGGIVVSIGAVVFDPMTGELGREFYRTIELASAEAAGLTIDADTVKWWLQQGDAARAALWQSSASLTAVLQHFTGWWNFEGGAFFWSHGANFDEPMLAAAYRAARLKAPWSYSASRCTRTIFHLAGVTIDRAVGVHHNALDDAKAQAAAVCQAYVKLGLAGAVRRWTLLGKGFADIGVERERQITTEGWTPDHDDRHGAGELEMAAATYAVSATDQRIFSRHVGRKIIDLLWPWSPDWLKPRDARRDLVRAGALIVAAIDKIDRAAAS